MEIRRMPDEWSIRLVAALIRVACGWCKCEGCGPCTAPNFRDNVLVTVRCNFERSCCRTIYPRWLPCNVYNVYTYGTGYIRGLVGRLTKRRRALVNVYTTLGHVFSMRACTRPIAPVWETISRGKRLTRLLRLQEARSYRQNTASVL